MYMPEAEVHLLDAIEKMGIKPDSQSYRHQTEENEMRNRIATLFSTKEGDTVKNDRSKKEEDDYETVNEEVTTDTTEAPNTAFKRG